jgi:hypothetical protein
VGLTTGSSEAAPQFFFARDSLPFFAPAHSEYHVSSQFCQLSDGTFSALPAKFNSSVIITND